MVLYIFSKHFDNLQHLARKQYITDCNSALAMRQKARGSWLQNVVSTTSLYDTTLDSSYVLVILFVSLSHSVLHIRLPCL